MKLFCDTSAVVPLVLREAATDTLWQVKQQATELWAWGWLRIELEAALARRRANSQAWISWSRLAPELCWVDLQTDQHDTLCAFNRGLALRAADAGHLFVFDRLLAEMPDLELLTLDAEMAAAARRLGLPLHPASAHL
jgi:predicted nucleic acid-binding protein